MVGAVKGVDPGPGFNYATQRYIDAIDWVSKAKERSSGKL